MEQQEQKRQMVKVSVEVRSGAAGPLPGRRPGTEDHERTRRGGTKIPARQGQGGVSYRTRGILRQGTIGPGRDSRHGGDPPGGSLRVLEKGGAKSKNRHKR